MIHPMPNPSAKDRALYGAALFFLAVPLLFAAVKFADSTDEPWPGFLGLGGIALIIAGAVVAFWTSSKPVPRDPSQPLPAGWYRDTESPSMRFWDGAAWTDQRAPLPSPYTGPSAARIGLAVAGGIALFVFLFGR